VDKNGAFTALLVPPVTIGISIAATVWLTYKFYQYWEAENSPPPSPSSSGAGSGGKRRGPPGSSINWALCSQKPNDRTNPAGRMEEIALEMAQAGNGQKIIDASQINDPVYNHQFDKMSFVISAANSPSIDVHYMRNPVTGETRDFKFVNQPNDTLGY
jgi:hypothetical protein